MFYSSILSRVLNFGLSSWMGISAKTGQRCHEEGQGHQESRREVEGKTVLTHDATDG